MSFHGRFSSSFSLSRRDSSSLSSVWAVLDGALFLRLGRESATSSSSRERFRERAACVLRDDSRVEGTGSGLLLVRERICETPKLPKYGLAGLGVKRGDEVRVVSSAVSCLMPSGFAAKKTSSTLWPNVLGLLRVFDGPDE